MANNNTILILLVTALTFGKTWASPIYLEAPIPDTSLAPGASLELNMVDYFSDVEDGELLGILDVSAQPANVVELSVLGVNRLSIRASATAQGRAVVVVKTTDAEQYIAVDTFEIVVATPEMVKPAYHSAKRDHFFSAVLRDNCIRFHWNGSKPGNVSLFDIRGRILYGLVVQPMRQVNYNLRSHASGVVVAALCDGKTVHRSKSILLSDH